MLYKNFRLRSEDDGNNGGGGEPVNGGQEPMSFDDFLKLEGNQAEFDRRVTKGINTAVAKERARLEALHSEQLTEAEKLAKMTEEERNQYKASQKEADIAKREAAITKRELMAEAKETLVSKGLPIKLAEIINYTSADSVKASIEAIEQSFNGAVSSAVEDKLKGGKPPKDASTEGKSKDKDEELKKQIYAGLGVRTN